MTHEFKDIVEAHLKAKKIGLKTVLASVVALDGSSYRKPGVRMLILENNEMIGAVSGGCVEKDILRQSQSVFKDGQSKMMTYDGRYRLGCEGVLYILLEEFKPDKSFLNVFENCLKTRQQFVFHSHYLKKEGIVHGIGSFVEIGGNNYPLSNKTEGKDRLLQFTQHMPPCFKLMIFGAEHDAVKLCQLASFNGWEVTVVSGPLESKTIQNFPGATAFYSVSPDDLELNSIDSETAIVLMSHNFANDLKYLLELKDTRPVYIGMLGPSHRREKLLSQFLEYCPDVDEQFLELIHGPAGLNIGAETPQEIAISILSEILSVVRSQTPMALKEKVGRIHN
ncbi:XdhC family protein [Flavobacteriaceae bacterium S0825]|uniref:XdhC family protein n=1 Tax=Gaetbulibacter sp. S0825 TaxID=2720084 RepID=UPI00142F56A5|nr:XdhC/CoxI family protein [Gaetbulibacter sp. S0825]MCK0108385.1 XdhC family protein [Flavobacteriaceae bacterium S0825]NIX64021.1 XdhC family protein [Gaetbulibacter sp. S0825]